VGQGLPRGSPTRQRWAPSADEYGQFAEAVARRYSGGWPDPDRRGSKLPAVRMWTTWNEPNHFGFLLPQWRRTRDGWRPASPHIYRALHNAGYASIKRVSEDNVVLLGGLAAKGAPGRGERVSMPPLRFTRELACVDELLQPLAIPECAGFQPLQADGFAVHPYSIGSAPDTSNPDLDTVQLGDLGRLSDLLRELHTSGRLATAMPLYITEYGYESNPPDIKRGVDPEQQARYLGHATYLAWRRGETRMFAQFLLNDLGPDGRYPDTSGRRWRDWQSGLYYHDGQPKPALQGFRMPFWAETQTVAGQPLVLGFGQIRPGAGPQTVTLEMLAPDGRWLETRSIDTRVEADRTCDSEARTFLTDGDGFYLRALPFRGSQTYRPRWTHADGSVEYGVPVTVSGP
jgi:hypothetical protein